MVRCRGVGPWVTWGPGWVGWRGGGASAGRAAVSRDHLRRHSACQTPAKQHFEIFLRVSFSKLSKQNPSTMSDEATVAPAENNVSTPTEVIREIIFIPHPLMLTRSRAAGGLSNTATHPPILNSCLVLWVKNKEELSFTPPLKSQ